MLLVKKPHVFTGNVACGLQEPTKNFRLEGKIVVFLGVNVSGIALLVP